MTSAIPAAARQSTDPSIDIVGDVNPADRHITDIPDDATVDPYVFLDPHLSAASNQAIHSIIAAWYHGIG